ncbi:60S ribosomal protein L14 [Eremomyces bilateralis CBS 781.70]|uniref:60S ribosomal protein L14 n=1 Tax=Eremomyces bilateralis CBS 781.70 TaxID=1392243 RepID=A0A6G1FSN7_9PEZI|nr:60S ribosomal protein L14 [Eremomyces bilateralis CBS 781.70]KAF1808773.1 60S ribosomal protein L14 [Eremomyces bilateralis CBS 781.70]
MGDATVVTSSWRLVEVGRVVLFAGGPYDGRLAAIVEIIDHKRVLIDGPSASADKVVPRHSAALAGLSLTPIVIPKLPRAIGNAGLKTKWNEAQVEKTFAESAWAKTRARKDKRKTLNDFERYKVMRLQKQKRFAEKVALAKVRASA